MSLIRKHVAVLQAWACLDLVYFSKYTQNMFKMGMLKILDVESRS